MAYETLQTIIGTAIVDPKFRHSLLEKEPEALRAFELTPEEKEALASIQADTFQGFARELHRWISLHSRAQETKVLAGIPSIAY